MRVWTRVAYRETCGGCGAQLEKGAAMQTIELRGLRRKLIRCERCVGDAPPSLPDYIEPETLEQKAAKLGWRFAVEAAPVRTRGALKTMAREYLPHPDD